jgi:hypothetical protein
MNVYETWVVYQPINDQLSAVVVGDHADDAWYEAWRDFYADEMFIAIDMSTWIREREADGWRCLRVVPAEGQKGTT